MSKVVDKEGMRGMNKVVRLGGYVGNFSLEEGSK